MKGVGGTRSDAYRERDAVRQLKLTFLLGAVSFGVALALVVGEKLSNPAATVLTGAVAGVAASVPVSLVLVALLRRREAGGDAVPRDPYWDCDEASDGYEMVPSWPVRGTPRWGELAAPQMPVIVVSPFGAGSDYGPRGTKWGHASPMSLPSAASREFQVVGEPEYEFDEDC